MTNKPSSSSSSPYSLVMAGKNLMLLRHLSNLVQRLKLLLSIRAYKWILYSLVASPSPHHKLRFERQPSLLDCATSSDLEDYYDACSSFCPSPSKSTTSPIASVSRTNSLRIGSATPEDIDKRAENFIADFYHHIWLERQDSPQLRLCNGKLSARWFPRRSPISPNSFLSFMPKDNVPSPASPPPFSTAIKISPRPASSSIKYPDPVPPLMKGRPTVVIHKPVTFSYGSMVQKRGSTSSNSDASMRNEEGSPLSN